MHLKSLLLGLCASVLLTNIASVQSAQAPLKVCSAENEMPYSNKKEQGFENKIASIVAEELGRPLQYVWWKDPRYYVRDLLDKGLCDVSIGLDSGDPRVLTTEAYYRSGYVFISRKQDQMAKKLEKGGWNSEVLKKAQRIAFVPNTPVEVMMRKTGLYNSQFNYMHELVNFKSRRNQYVKYDTAKLVSEVESGNAQLAILWGPAAARYVSTASDTLEMTVIADNNQRADGQPVPHHFSTSLGVRKADQQLLTQLNQALAKRQKDIQAILKQEGIPLLKEGNNTHG